MQKQARLEQILRAALSEKAKEINTTSGMWQNVKDGIITKEERKFMSVKNFYWPKALAGAMCTLILASILTVCFSPQAQVWARDMVKSITKVFSVVKTENGYKVVPANPDDKSDSKKIMFKIEVPEPGIGEVVRIPLKFFSKYQDQQIVMVYKPNPKNSIVKYYSAAEAEAKTGSPVYLPGYLPEGYTFDYITADHFGKNTASEKNKNIKSLAYGRYITTDKKVLSLLITNETRLTIEGGQSLPNVAILGNGLYWAKFSVVTITNDNREPETLTGHSLLWLNSDISYVLSDESGNLAQEEMIKTAQSIK